MIVLHIAPINTTRVNGFRFSVPGLIEAQNKLGIQAALLNIEKTKMFSEENLEKNNFKIYHYEGFNLNKIKPPFNKPDLVVFHGVYKVEYISLYKCLSKLNIPYIIVPRVSLTKGAQNQKSIKKKISNLLLFNKFIYSSSSIQYLTENERKLSDNFNKKNFVVGNGVDLPVSNDKIINKKINLTFIGRFDINHKGLDVLMLAIIQLKEFLEKYDVKVNLYGSDFNNGKKQLLRLTEENNLEDILSVNNAVFLKEKEEVLRKTDVFLATSRFEGHPMAVIEAMSYGIPCILTEGTNMLEELEKYDAGWKTELDPTRISASIAEAIQNPTELIVKGQNARKLTEENYTWESIGKKTIEFYEEVISGA
ncbi:glycosyltransferase family 4 protein [Halobacillus sp. A1]|uniref:glycosyltransferase family 4 protein n=1 Tax=Halobacillus sp. A1 TaxID=2880262 RepID=UPI0020A68844|nr:glycosyltransferase family 4 protein [Halobacillus sp. A1]MCP3032934.1 glycosyltransferase family 4 protein [Halobacillus sp. A1]